MIKKVSVLLMCALMLLSGCKTESEPVEQSITYIMVDDERIELPFRFDSLESIGYSVERCDIETIVRGGNNTILLRGKDDAVVMVNLGAYEDGASIEDSYVIDILADVLVDENSSLRVLGGIQLGSLEEDVVRIFGNPIVENDGYNVYMKCDEESTHGTFILVRDGVVVRVEVMNAVGFY